MVNFTMERGNQSNHSRIEEEAAAGQGTLGLGQLRGIHWSYLETSCCYAITCSWEGGSEEDRVADPQDVGGVRL